MARRASEVHIESTAVSGYRIPTESPQSDGTLEWDSTVLVVARISAGGQCGLGYGYADAATAGLIRDTLFPLMSGRDILAINARWQEMVAAIRNLGRPGICSMALSVVHTALWDLKAKYLGLSLADLLGRARPDVPLYASGGFTSLSLDDLQDQLGDWARQGMTRIKMKVGRHPQEDAARVAAAARSIGEDAVLFVDANGAYSRKQALAFAELFAEHRVAWFEEPVSSDDLAGLRLLRDRAPAGMEISAGEYGYDLPYFRRMLEAEAVDVLQADATRCGGVTGFLGVAALCEAYAVPLSSHCAPSLHAPLCCAARPAVHLEYFHDHARIERLLFDGAPRPVAGRLAPSSATGLGLEFKEKDAACYKIL